MDKYVNGSGLKYFWDKIKDVFQPKGNYLAEESIFPWAKAQTKPTYTAAETGADPAGSATTALASAKTYTDDVIRESDFATKQYVAQQVGQNVFKKQIVTSLPTTDIDQNTIYMILKADAAGNDNYNEYINLTGTSAGWEFLGNTNASLTDYYNKAEANNLFVLNANVDAALSTTSTNPVQNKVVTENINQINGNLGGCSFEQEGTDFYVTGADSVRKKLGSGTVYSYYFSDTLWYTKTLNLKTAFPNYYQNLVLYKNIFPVVNGTYASASGGNGSAPWSWSYNAGTGILTVSVTGNGAIVPNGTTVYIVS